jgi:hypothetical protein
MKTDDEMQALLQRRVAVLHVERDEAEKEARLGARGTVYFYALGGAITELLMLAKHLGLGFEDPLSPSDEDEQALYPSSTFYEDVTKGKQS